MYNKNQLNFPARVIPADKTQVDDVSTPKEDIKENKKRK